MCTIKKIIVLFRINAIVTSGLIQKWVKKYLRDENQCDKSMSSVSHVKTRITDTKGAYVALALGLALALLVFAMELVTKTFQDVSNLLRRRN